jgi:hypothetical protein
MDVTEMAVMVKKSRRRHSLDFSSGSSGIEAECCGWLAWLPMSPTRQLAPLELA